MIVDSSQEIPIFLRKTVDRKLILKKRGNRINLESLLRHTHSVSHTTSATMVLASAFGELQNATPRIFSTLKERPITSVELDENIEDPIDEREVFDLIRDINDPEHPLSLEQLNVVSEELVNVDNATRVINVQFTPTIPHCSMATLIGLCIRVKLLRCLPREYKIDLMITPGKHNQEHAINKQLQDKERVAAALENPKLLSVVNQCIAEPGY